MPGSCQLRRMVAVCRDNLFATRSKYPKSLWDKRSFRPQLVNSRGNDDRIGLESRPNCPCGR